MHTLLLQVLPLVHSFLNTRARRKQAGEIWSENPAVPTTTTQDAGLYDGECKTGWQRRPRRSRISLFPFLLQIYYQDGIKPSWGRKASKEKVSRFEIAFEFSPSSCEPRIPSDYTTTKVKKFNVEVFSLTPRAWSSFHHSLPLSNNGTLLR